MNVFARFAVALGVMYPIVVRAQVTPGGLRCEYLANPLAVDAAQPRLSWVCESPERGQFQTAYRIVVASDPLKLARDEGDLWDSGQVESDQSAQVAYSGKALASGTRAAWKVRAWDRQGHQGPWSEPAYWEMGLLSPNDWQAKWIAHPGAATPAVAGPATLARKGFQLPGPVRRGKVYVSALGVYQLRLNGTIVGSQALPPEWTDYHTRVQYQAYDVTSLLRHGENVFGALVGDGWYAGRIGMSDGIIKKLRHVYGAKPHFMLQAEIEMADGQTTTVATDSSWMTTAEGPIRSSDLLDGEVYDARRETIGWDKPGFDHAGWTPGETLDSYPGRLVAQMNEPIRVIQSITPVGLAEPKPGMFVFDLGQNMVGRCRIELHSQPGSTVTLRHAEMTNEDGTVYLANLRGAPQVDRYTSRGGGAEAYEPTFTQHGFRYVEVAGLPGKPSRTSLTGCVFNSAPRETGAFQCSDPMLNQLWRNILWTQRANLMSVPTDCPQRDERLGWMGDIQAFSQTAIFNMDLAAFFTKWTQDIRDAQADDGRFPDFAPHPFGRNERFTGVPAWGDAGVVVPWRAYVNYADRRLLDRHFSAAARWVDWITSQNPDLIWRKGRHNDYNDWLNGDTLRQTDWPTKGGMVPQEVFATAFFAHSTDIVARMARVLERDEDARKYRDRFQSIKAAFNREFVAADGRIRGDTQAGYALALDFSLLPEALEKTAVAHMVEGIHRYGNRLSTGIQSTHRLMLELVRHGQEQLSWRLLTNRCFPSWGYMIDNGATTIWERWDGYVKGRGFQDPGMNSFNHWALGAIGEWMYRHVLGINPDESHPGYRQFTVRPRPGGGLTWARGHYDSIKGRIAVAWAIKDGTFTLDLTVPVNATARLYVPAQDSTKILEGGRPAAEAPGVKALPAQDKCALFSVGSGSYHFSAPRSSVR